MATRRKKDLHALAQALSSGKNPTHERLCLEEFYARVDISHGRPSRAIGASMGEFKLLTTLLETKAALTSAVKGAREGGRTILDGDGRKTKVTRRLVLALATE